MTEIERPRLDELAEEINQAHRACDEAMRSGLRHALQAGELLAQAKEEVPYGQWEQWLKENFEGSPRTARAYMQVHRDYMALPEPERQRVAELPYRGVLKALAAPTEEEEPAKTGEPARFLSTETGDFFPASSINEEIAERGRRAVIEAERQAVIEAVAEVNDLDFDTVRREYRQEVSAIRDAVERRDEEREEKGESFSAEERKDYAKRLATAKKRSRDRARREREEDRQKHFKRFIEVDADLGKARSLVREAIKQVQDVPFTEEEIEHLQSENEALQSTSRLFSSALTGDSGTDWDAELFRIEHKHQWGEEPEEWEG